MSLTEGLQREVVGSVFYQMDFGVFLVSRISSSKMRRAVVVLAEAVVRVVVGMGEAEEFAGILDVACCYFAHVSLPGDPVGLA